MLGMRGAMYVIRVRPGGEMLEAVFEGPMPIEEALRAVSQGFALAEAGKIGRALVELSGPDGGPESVLPLAAAFRMRLGPDQRVALLCAAEQLPGARRFARLTGVRDGLGIFTRAEDAEEWLAGRTEQRLSHTALRHLGAFEHEAPSGDSARRGVA